MTSLTCRGRIMYQLINHALTNLQEDVMNKRQIVLAVLIICVTTNLSQAQTFFPVLKKYSSEDKARADKIYSDCLSSNHNGIIEGTLSIVAMMQLDVPSDKFPKIKDQIDDLAIDGATQIVRYKAYLARAVFANPAMFKEEAVHQYSNPEIFFNALAERMAKTFLSSI
jgi:hypothetical protein